MNYKKHVVLMIMLVFLVAALIIIATPHLFLVGADPDPGPAAILDVSLPEGAYFDRDVSDPWLNECWNLTIVGTLGTFTVRINNTSAADPSHDTRLIIVLNDVAYSNIVSLSVDTTTILKTAFKSGTPKPYGIWDWPSGDVYPTWFNDTIVNVGTIGKKVAGVEQYKEVAVSVQFSDTTNVRMHFDAYGSKVSPPPTTSGDITHNSLSKDSTVLFSSPPVRADLSITKSGPDYAHVGDLITYIFTVSNAGPNSATGIVVTDNKAGTAAYVSGDINSNGKLDVSETWTFTASYIVLDTDPDPLPDTATVSSSMSDPNLGDNQASWSVDVLHPKIKVTKTADKTMAHEDDTITYTYTVTNSGDTTLKDVSVSDDVAGTAAYLSGDIDGDCWLDTDETWTFKATYKVKGGDPDPLVNTVTASGRDILGREATDSATASVDLIAKICGYKFRDDNMNGVWDAGEPPVEGIKIELWLAGYKIKETITGPEGKYCFNGLNAGTYTLKEVLPANWINTTLSSLFVTIKSGEVSEENNFGNYQAPTPPPPPVGGVWVPINKFDLLAPWIGLASLFACVAVVSAIYVKHRKKEKA